MSRIYNWEPHETGKYGEYRTGLLNNPPRGQTMYDQLRIKKFVQPHKTWYEVEVQKPAMKKKPCEWVNAVSWLIVPPSNFKDRFDTYERAEEVYNDILDEHSPIEIETYYPKGTAVIGELSLDEIENRLSELSKEELDTFIQRFDDGKN